MFVPVKRLEQTEQIIIDIRGIQYCKDYSITWSC